MKKKILFVINTLGGAGAEMALLELLEKLEKENEKTKDVQYRCLLCSDGAGGTGEKTAQRGPAEK